MTSWKKKPVLVNYVKQQNYRDRANKSVCSESAEQRNVRKVKDQLRYITDKKLPKVKAKMDEVKSDKKKTKSKTKKRVMNIKLKKLFIEIKMAKAEQVEPMRKLFSKK